jgi:hypothetical protein
VQRDLAAWAYHGSQVRPLNNPGDVAGLTLGAIYFRRLRLDLVRIVYVDWMRDNEGYEIRNNGVARSFRDKRETAFDAARFGKSRNPRDRIEVLDRATGNKLIMLADGRVT